MLNLFRIINYRIYQFNFYVASFLMRHRKPILITGAGSIHKLPEVLKKHKIDRVLLVTDKGLSALGLPNPLMEDLSSNNIQYFVYDGVQQDPSVENIEQAKSIYEANNCEGVIAFGGGSPMDCAKAAAARVANPKKSVKKMRGLLKVTNSLPPLFAVPTTAGTGSECTIVAVVKDNKSQEKYAVTDFKLCPLYAVLDPELTLGLPKHITAWTGLDALTHAVEAYIGQKNTKESAELGLKAVKLIFESLEKAYQNGEDIYAREQMLLASHYAGLAFTRAYVGYVHAIAHNLGGLYSIPHGLANAVVLPYVLEYYGSSVYRSLAELADFAGLASANQSTEEKAKVFISAVKELLRKFDIPEHFEQIRDEDIPLIVSRALHEANPLYPVPKIMFEDDCTALVKKIKG